MSHAQLEEPWRYDEYEAGLARKAANVTGNKPRSPIKEISTPIQEQVTHITSDIPAVEDGYEDIPATD